MARLRVAGLSASGSSSSRLRVGGLSASGSPYAPPTTPRLRVAGLSASGAAAVIVVPPAAVAVGAGQTGLLVAALADGGVADSWAWSCDTLALVGSGPVVSVVGPSRMPPGQTHTVTVRATCGGVTSAPVTVAVTVLPRLRWSSSGSGTSRSWGSAGVEPHFPFGDLLVDETWATPMAEGGWDGSPYAARYRVPTDGELDTSRTQRPGSPGQYDRSTLSVRDGMLVVRPRTVGGVARCGKVVLGPTLPGLSPWRGQRWGLYRVRVRFPAVLPGWKSVPLILWPDDTQGTWATGGEIDVLEVDDLVATARAKFVNFTPNGTSSPTNTGFTTEHRPVDGRWHTADLVWTPAGSLALFDGQVVGTAPGAPPSRRMWAGLQVETRITPTGPAADVTGEVHFGRVQIWGMA